MYGPRTSGDLTVILPVRKVPGGISVEAKNTLVQPQVVVLPMMFQAIAVVFGISMSRLIVDPGVVIPRSNVSLVVPGLLFSEVWDRTVSEVPNYWATQPANRIAMKTQTTVFATNRVLRFFHHRIFGWQITNCRIALTASNAVSFLPSLCRRA